MLNEHLDITIALVFTIALANVVVVPIMFLFAGTIAKFTALRPTLIAPFVAGVVLLSAFQSSASMADLGIVAAFTALGLFMKAYGWPRTPILIALVLIPTVEKNLWTASQAYGWEMLTRPQFLAILIIGVGLVVWTARTQRSAEVAAQSQGFKEATTD